MRKIAFLAADIYSRPAIAPPHRGCRMFLHPNILLDLKSENEFTE